jgi:hypothetical protein
MDKHLALLAKKHLETKFVKVMKRALHGVESSAAAFLAHPQSLRLSHAPLQIHAEKSPYLTDKLKILVLPTLALIKSEKTVDYVVGFGELGNTDEFGTNVLAERLGRAGLIKFEVNEEYGVSCGMPRPRRDVWQSTIRKGGDPDDEDSDFDT